MEASKVNQLFMLICPVLFYNLVICVGLKKTRLAILQMTEDKMSIVLTCSAERKIKTVLRV